MLWVVKASCVRHLTAVLYVFVRATWGHSDCHLAERNVIRWGIPWMQYHGECLIASFGLWAACENLVWVAWRKAIHLIRLRKIVHFNELKLVYKRFCCWKHCWYRVWPVSQCTNLPRWFWILFSDSIFNCYWNSVFHTLNRYNCSAKITLVRKYLVENLHYQNTSGQQGHVINITQLVRLYLE